MQLHFKHILAVQDAYGDSTDALVWADRLASAGAKLKVFDVEPLLSSFWSELFDNDWEETPVAHRLKSLCKIVNGYDFKNVTPSIKVGSGRPIVQIIQEVISARHDLIVKRIHTKAGDIVFGRLDMRLMRNSPVPVLLAQSETQACHRVMVAINPDADETEMRLNDELIRQASIMACVQGCELYVVAAWHEPKFNFEFSEEAAKRLKRHAKIVCRRRKDQLKAVVDRSLKKIAPNNIVFRNGAAEDVIASAVRQFEPDVLVMGTIARHGLSRLLLGSTAESVLRQVGCSVLMLKPRDFVCPIPISAEKSDGWDGSYSFSMA